MSMIMVRGGFNAWPTLLQFLTDNVAHTELTIVENSILSISIVVEDCTSLFQEDQYTTLIEYMVKPIFGLLGPQLTSEEGSI